MFNIRAFLDSGCLCWATIAEQYVNERKIPTILIPLRRLEQVTESKNPPTISRISALNIDIGGYEKTIWAYVIPGQTDNLILGKKWMEFHDITIRPAKNQITFHYPIRFTFPTTPIPTDPTITEISSLATRAFQVRASNQKSKDITIFSATLADI
jgi:hypothetical protein